MFFNNIRFLIFIFGLVSFSSGFVEAIMVASAVEVRVTVEDAEMQQAVVKEAKFDGKNIDLSKKSFMHRKVSKVFKVAPGQYEIEWTTEKSLKPWGGDKEIKSHQRLIVIEISDAIVYINIRGENLTTY